ncbi:class I SAM-dependent methyltransferase [Micromonospora aurantiaca (nom. illeg.)]|uniref:class I SAM-dependent methyltransferase n=1 Tax=Micromonospora aurantiaca (nom. illeg.) TaxID=47850 RepID=UPI0033FF353A
MALHSYGTNPQDWFAWLGERLPLSGDVLEVGAGTGELWHRIGHRPRLTLTDFSPAMCARLREVPGARVLRCDATHLPFRTGVVPAAEPILAYIASMIGSLTAAQEASARAAIEARIDAEGTFRVRKHTVLISATRGSR